MSSPLVWLITGTSSGIGRDLAFEALKRGDKVIATGRARSISKLADLQAAGANVLELDVTAPLETLHEVAKKAVEIHGRIDVLVNNAGYLIVGALEENTPEETFAQYNTNVFGALNVSRAFLPYMRARRSGTVIFMGSVGGWIASPYASLYVSTKWALRGISETLDAEISPLGLRSVCLDYGYFRTKLLAPGSRGDEVMRIPDYAPLSQLCETSLQAYNGKQLGDPVKGAQLVVDLVKGEGVTAGMKLPVSLAVGSDCYQMCTDSINAARDRLEEWKEVSSFTDFQ